LLMTTDEALMEAARAVTPDDWQPVAVSDLEEVGEWSDILLHRFLILDADEAAAFDPVETVRLLRREYMVNIPVIAVGGDQGLRDELKMERADRFFERDQVGEVVSAFTGQYDWG
ncbi:MAG: hypothetical protein ACOCUM_01900, partial [Thiohalospira sp.]